jgi:uncharacterized protein YkwD
MKKLLIFIAILLSMGADQSAKDKLMKNPLIIAMYNQNNIMRQRVGLPAQQLNFALVCAAQNHANYMAKFNRLDHFLNGNPSQRAREYGYVGGVAENIARGQRGVVEVFNDWKSSRGHYKNMRSNAKYVGVGCQRGSNGQWYWVTLYGY